ncbi:MAG: ATP-dependent zinc metalloprotease FtsH [Planctomycetota bacterium]
MPDPKIPPNDKSKKARSFGSYALFILVLVAVLIYMGGLKYRQPLLLTQDQFEYKLYTGEIDHQKFVGMSEIEGTLKGSGGDFKVLVENRAGRAEEYQQIKAQAAFHPIGMQALLQAVEGKWYAPQLVRVLSRVHDPAGAAAAVPATPPEPARPPAVRQDDRLFARVVAKSKSEWKDPAVTEPPFYLPAASGTVWLEVEDVGDMGKVLSTLTAAGAKEELLTFDLRKEKGTSLQDSNTLFTQVLFMWLPWLLIFVVFLVFMRQMRNQGAAGGVMSFGRSRAQLYTKENRTNVTFDDVAGADEAKDEVREVVEFLKNPGRFTRVGGRIPRGVLLVGAPGCGKTLLAKAIAGEAEVPFFSISGSDFVEMFVGVGASRVRDLFKQARENSPCIIFLDEIDAVGRRRGSGLGGGHDEREQTLNAILVEMDGFGTDDGIIVVAATNRPDVLDPALLRPGRFDREVVIDLPDIKGREEILRVHLKKVKADPDVVVSTLARSTPGYSGADIAAIINEAAIMAALQKKDAVTMEHLEEARDKVRYGRQKKSRKIEEEDRRITAYHEAGHAVVASILPEVDDPHKVTIVPRGRALGSTMVLPDKESYHMQRKKMVGQLAWAFGGRVAEAVFCGDISAGAADDIRRATEIARAMVTELGMSDKIGPINYAERHGSDFLGTELMSGKWHSEETARQIDQEVEKLLKDAYQTAERIVTENRAFIEKVANSLLAYETISGEEISRLFAGAAVEGLRPEPTVEKPAGPAGKAAGAGAVGTPRSKPGELPGTPGLSPA